MATSPNLNSPQRRYISVDVFRGLTIALMILVNSPGYPHAYPWLEHSVWNGCSLADIVFPFFIIIVGMSVVLSPPRSYSFILKRTLFLFTLGLLLNAFPQHFDLHAIRIPGVLQRIALCYAFSALLFRSTSLKQQMIVALILLVGYWIFLRYCPNMVAFTDQYLLGPQHLLKPHFDPEGLWSTVPAFGSVLLGHYLGYCLLSSQTNRYKCYKIIALGCFLLAIGWIWQWTLPFNKSLWSSSYVLWTAGWAYFVFAFCFYYVEIKSWTYGLKPFILFGQHALLIFVLHVIGLKIQAHLFISLPHQAKINLQHMLTLQLFGHLSPLTASLCYACGYTLLWWLFLFVWTRMRGTQKHPFNKPTL